MLAHPTLLIVDADHFRGALLRHFNVLRIKNTISNLDPLFVPLGVAALGLGGVLLNREKKRLFLALSLQRCYFLRTSGKTQDMLTSREACRFKLQGFPRNFRGQLGNANKSVNMTEHAPGCSCPASERKPILSYTAITSALFYL